MTLATVIGDLTPVVEPGQETSVDVVVRNTGDVVDQFTVDVVGAAAQWSRVEPATVNLMPGSEATLQVVFAPPRASAPLAGRVPFGVRVRSREDPGASSVQESHLEVSAFTVLTTELLPAKRRARRRGTYRLLVENTGNTPTSVRAIGLDPEGDQLVIRIDPAVATIAPATAVLLRVRVSPQQRLLRGQPVNHPFELEVTQESAAEPDADADADAADGGTAPIPTPAADAVPLTVGGTLVQQPLLPRWLVPALLVLLGLVVALVVLWFALLKPAVQSIATERAQEEIVAAAAPGGLLEDVAAGGGPDGSGDGGAGDGAAGDGGGGDSGAGPGGSDGSGPGAGEPGDGSGDPAGGGTDAAAGAPGPIGFRIATDAAVVSDGSFQQFTFDVPAGRAMDIGDLVLQNPRGDTGFLRIVLNDEIVIEAGLANFRDLDYHYVTPLRVAPGTPVVVAVNCVAPGTDATRCTPAVSFSGTVLR